MGSIVSEISVLVEFHNVFENWCQLMVNKLQNIVETSHVPAGYYDTMDTLLDVLNRLVGDMSITF